ncbi:MAG: HNH endonuclease [Halioglobus sp.]
MLDIRWEVFSNLAPYFGRVVPASFIQKTAETISGITRVHNLIEGIYKPADSSYALTIASMLKNPYADRLEFAQDRSWFFHYSPKSGSLDSKVNLSLFNCMRDSEPVLVIKQLSDKTHAEGTRYKILGLGLIESFDDKKRLFRIHEVTIDAFQQKVAPGEVLSDDLIETALQLESLEAWSPFVAEDRAVYKVSKQKRDAAFRKIVLENYGSACAVTASKFIYGKYTEAQAAHIISKEVKGTDDPRNGLALSHTAHWAFDRGIFTISDQYEVQVHSSADKSKSLNFQILDMHGKGIFLPKDADYYPHQEALRWHREEVFGHFKK